MSVESSQICITAAESWIWPVVAINENKRQCGVIVTIFLVPIKRSLQNMSGSLSVRGCTALFRSPLQKATAFLARKIKLFWEGGLVIYLKSSLWGSGSLASLNAEQRVVCALGLLTGDGEQPLPTCSSPAPGTAGEPGEMLFTSLRALVAPFSSSSLPGKWSLLRSHVGSPWASVISVS